MTRVILALNAGSSSLKFAAFEADGLGELLRGEASGIGGEASLRVRDGSGGALLDRPLSGRPTLEEAARLTLAWLAGQFAGEVAAVGHRIVHGGPDFHAPRLLDPAAAARLEDFVAWAPLHQPAALALLRQAAAHWPGAAQVGCFDTGFHHAQPAVARRFALPRALEAEGVRRYGFHGLSCQSAMTRLSALDPDMAAGRVLIAHFGSGSSLTAVRAGRSLDSSMGFSPLDGLVMSTRCGALDPGVILYLQTAHGMNPQAVEALLYHEAGLLGASGISGDMRVLLASNKAAAREAVELFLYRAAREAGALAGCLGGLDGVVFTGGVGENTPAIRAGLAERLNWLGLRLDAAANLARGDRRISAAASRVRAWVLAADEERVIAGACAELASAQCEAAGPIPQSSG